MALGEAGIEQARTRVALFGEFRAFDTAGNEIALSNRRARAILAMLCIAPGETIEREQLSRMLWPGRFKTQARASLRQCLHDLNRLLLAAGYDLLDLQSSRIAVRPGLILSDLQELESALAKADHGLASRILVETAGRKLLEGLDDGEPLVEWIAARRLHIDSRLQISVHRLLEALKSSGEQTAAAALADAWQPHQPAAARSGKIGVAVLPFEQFDELGETLFLSEGVVDELCSRLSAIAEVSLAGRTSVAAMVQSGLTLPEMAARLGVTHLIEGTVLRTAEHATVTIRLVDGTSGRETWSERLQDTVEGFFGSRQVFGSNVIASLCRALGIENTTARHRRMTTNREAYALFLQGRSMLQRISGEDGYGKGIEFFERALAIDPEFAECWTALANAHIMRAAITPSLTRVEQSAEGAVCARRALELDPGQGHAYSILGIHDWTLFNPARGLERAFEAFARDPNDADVASRLGSCLLYLGKSREALPYVEAAVELDPVYGRNYAMLASAYLSLGDFDKARMAGKRMVDLGFPGMWLALAEFAAGDYEAAVQTHFGVRVHLGTVLMPPPGMPPMDDAARDAYFAFAARGLFSGDAANRAAYCQMLDGLHATMPDPHDSTISFPAIWMGHSELVMKLYSERIHPANMFGLMSLWIDIDPINRTIRHPGFMDFAERIGMVEAWDRFGWPDLIPADPRKA